MPAWCPGPARVAGIDNGLGHTPPMGWRGWLLFEKSEIFSSYMRLTTPPDGWVSPLS